jgi:hypothetical protein
MAKRKPTPLAAALLAVDALSPEEILTLADYLRSKTATPRKKAVKKEQPKPVLIRDEMQSASTA